MEKLRDIRGLEEIPDISIYLFLMMIFFAFIFLSALFFMLYKKFIVEKKLTVRMQSLQNLKNIDFADSKKAAYDITRYARVLCDDKRSFEVFHQLQEKLKKYKFVKDSPKFDDESIKYYHLFLEMVNE